MLAQVSESAPEEENAKRYHDISLQALECSKKMLFEKQTQCLKHLGALVGSPATTTEDLSAKPRTLVESLSNATEESNDKSATWKGWAQADIEAVPEFVPQIDISSKLIGSGSLRQDLELLRERPPECVIIVRKIKKLGFESPQILNDHFSKYGEVKELLVAHSHVKPTSKRPNGRVRPAALGFVVMATEEDAQNAFKAGSEQTLCGVGIELGTFESFDSHYAEEEEN